MNYRFFLCFSLHPSIFLSPLLSLPILCFLGIFLLFLFPHLSLSLSQVAHARIRFLESHVEGLVKSEASLRDELTSLQQEHSDLQHSVTQLQALLTSHGIQFTSAPS